MISNKEIMAQARAHLKGHWGNSVGALIVLFIASFVFTIVTQIPLTIFFGDTIGGLLEIFLELFICAPAGIGFVLFFHKLVSNGEEDLGDIFQPVADLFHAGRRKIYWRNIRGILFMSVVYLIICLVCYIPCLISIALNFYAGDIADATKPTALTAPFMVTFILFMIAAILYAPATIIFYYRLATDETVNAVPCLKESYKMSVKYRLQFWKLCCRFIGWYLLCCITLGIAGLWIGPYMTTSFVIYCREIVEKPAAIPAEIVNE